MSTINEDCGNCRYWKENQRDRGSCRRHPPIVMYMPNMTVPIEKTTFPLTGRSDWCGEFKKEHNGMSRARVAGV